MITNLFISWLGFVVLTFYNANTDAMLSNKNIWPDHKFNAIVFSIVAFLCSVFTSGKDIVLFFIFFMFLLVQRWIWFDLFFNWLTRRPTLYIGGIDKDKEANNSFIDSIVNRFGLNPVSYFILKLLLNSILAVVIVIYLLNRAV